MKFDFSQFHPLDHWAATSDCFRWSGGPWNHIRLWWEFQFEYRPIAIRHRVTGCLWGHHEWGEVWKKGGEIVAFACHWCDLSVKVTGMPTPVGFGLRGIPHALCRVCGGHIVKVKRNWEHALPSPKTQGHEAVPVEDK